jgi:hypothetical protein
MCVYICTYIHIYIYTYIYAPIYIYLYAHIHTHTHTAAAIQGPLLYNGRCCYIEAVLQIHIHTYGVCVRERQGEAQTFQDTMP